MATERTTSSISLEQFLASLNEVVTGQKKICRGLDQLIGQLVPRSTSIHATQPVAYY